MAKDKSKNRPQIDAACANLKCSVSELFHRSFKATLKPGEGYDSRKVSLDLRKFLSNGKVPSYVRDNDAVKNARLPERRRARDVETVDAMVATG